MLSELSMTTQDIARSLYQSHYQSSSASAAVISQHWREHGKNQVLFDGKNVIGLRGDGFGDFISNKFINRIRFLPESLMLKKFAVEHDVRPEILSGAYRVLGRMGCMRNFDSIKQVIVLSKVYNALRVDHLPFETVAVIGDGFGFLSSLLKELNPKISVVTINLGKQLLFDVQGVRRAHPGAKVGLGNIQSGIADRKDFTFLEAENYEELSGQKIDLFFNIASMQEMNPQIVENYFKLIRSSRAKKVYFYCCNRVKKVFSDGTTVEFLKYPWKNADQFLIDEEPTWYRAYPSKRWPFWLPFDGPFLHRLAIMQSDQKESIEGV